MQIGAGTRRRTSRQVEVIDDWKILTSAKLFHGQMAHKVPNMVRIIWLSETP
jgi:hypothetical protein